MSQKKPASTLYTRKVINTQLSVPIGHRHLHHEGLEWKVSHRLGYQVSFIPNSLQLKHEMVFACGESLTAGATTGPDLRAARLVHTHKHGGEVGKSEEGADAQEMENYLMCSEFSKKGVLSTTFVHLTALLCI